MSRAGMIFALFCLGVIVWYFNSARTGYSPFAPGGGGGFFYAGGRSAGGPQHK